MRASRAIELGLIFTCFAGVLAGAPVIAHAQVSARAPMTRDEIAALARVYIAISRARDSAEVQLGQPGNRAPEAQQLVWQTLRTNIAGIQQRAGISADDYRRKTYVLSTNDEVRRTFDVIVADLTGVPMRGSEPPPSPGGRGRGTDLTGAMPDGAPATHIAHVAVAFRDTPEGAGLLTVAVAEARVAAQHATLAARDLNSLIWMQMHTNHVVHAIDPTVVTTGPGRGYGLKKASAGVATHIELAAKAEGASPNVVAHAVHIAASARNTAERAEKILALAAQVQAATSATDAAPLVSQIASLADQLVKGADLNADAKIGWENGEGGLQQAQDHVSMMLVAERK